MVYFSGTISDFFHNRNRHNWPKNDKRMRKRSDWRMC